MPFKSQAQRKFMFSQHPEIAKKWAKHTKDAKDLPEKLPESEHVEEKVDNAQLRTPANFMDYVDSFLKELDTDLKSLQHFANTYANSTKLQPADKQKFQVYTSMIKNLGDISKRAAQLPKDFNVRQPPAPPTSTSASKNASSWDKLRGVFGK